MARKSRSQDAYRQEAEKLLDHLGESGSDLDRRLAADMIRTAARLLDDGCDTGQMKLMANALKEMRTSWRVFNAYRGTRKIAIYGSARTPEDHPDYVETRPPPPEWAVEDDEVTDIERLNKITNGIVLGIPKDQVVQNRAEGRSWDRLAVQIEKIHASGKSVHIINE